MADIIAYLLQTSLLILCMGNAIIAETSSSESGSSSPTKVAFGEGNPPSIHVPIVEASQSVSTKQFFLTHVAKPEAVVFKGAVLKSPAVTLWTDDYFLNLKNVPDNHDVLVESRKKENRSVPTTNMPFKQFIQIYNHTNQYMVEPVPPFLRKDFMLPHHFQCQQFMKDVIVETMMWISSGGTSSVVHTDSVENLNCLIAGRKRFVIVPPDYKDKVLIDHPEGAYSGIDVDDVDYSKYPGLADVKFMHADMEAGDCLYIPFKWIHQVRSYDRNIAVNIWWDSYKNNQIDLDKCDRPFDPNWTLDKVETTGFETIDSSPAMIRDYITEVIKDNSLYVGKFIASLHIPMMEDPGFVGSIEHEQAMSLLRKAFAIIDVSKDGEVNAEDLNSMPDVLWSDISAVFKEIQDIQQAAEVIEDNDVVHDEL